MRSRTADFFIAGMIPLILLAALQIPDFLAVQLLAASAAAYGFTVLLDVRSTISFGRAAVGRFERAVIFRLATRRFGFAAAILMQIMLEMVLALVVVPQSVLGWSIQSACGSLSAFAMLHLAGWRSNSPRRAL